MLLLQCINVGGVCSTCRKASGTGNLEVEYGLIVIILIIIRNVTAGVYCSI